MSSPRRTHLKLVEQFRGDPESVADRFFAGAQYLAFLRRHELHGARHARRHDRTTDAPLRAVRSRPNDRRRHAAADHAAAATRNPASNCPAARIRSLRPANCRARGSTRRSAGIPMSRVCPRELHLPPGWRLLWTHGVDRAPTAWLASWTLWDIFLVVISVVLALRLLGRAAAAVFAVTLVLVYQEPARRRSSGSCCCCCSPCCALGRGRLGQFARLSYFVVLAIDRSRRVVVCDRQLPDGDLSAAREPLRRYHVGQSFDTCARTRCSRLPRPIAELVRTARPKRSS